MQEYEVSLTMLGSIVVKANSEKEAIEIAKLKSQQELRTCIDEFVSVGNFAVPIFKKD